MAIRDVLFNVLTEVSQLLGGKGRWLERRPDDVIALVGRALFVRFLLDRNIINSKTFPALYRSTTPEQCFDTPQAAAVICHWLHKIFNGELLPLADGNFDGFFAQLHKKDPHALSDLSLILRQAPGRQLSFELFWKSVSFAHVPVGLLSQVYERNAHTLFKTSAKKESIYYTPRFIAEFMVSEAFAGIDTVPKDRARLVDPAAGAGVFLVACLRRLVQERWKATGRRPNGEDIRAILREQVFGFDINSWALRLSALSLYLTVLELDPAPEIGPKIKFDKLLDRNLFVTRAKDEPYPETLVLGSLGAGAPQGHDGKYDLAIGNPPWTAWSGPKDKVAAIADQAMGITRAVLANRGEQGQFDKLASAYENPDNVPDLPFVWKGMQWTKAGGVICFALHGRLLFKRSEPGTRARNTLFSALHVTGILNGTRLDKAIWPGMDQPFCLLFARNEVPRDGDAFQYLCPEADRRIGKEGRFRVDYASAQPVQISVLRDNPALLKTLMVGTILDADLARRLRALVPDEGDQSVASNKRCFMRIRDYWVKKNGLDSGQGFFDAPKLKQRSAAFIEEMGALILTMDDKPGYLINAKDLLPFKLKELHRPRRKAIYQPPLALISESPGATREKIRARLYLDETPIAYKQSFFGYTAHGHTRAKELVKYLFVLGNSDLFTYYHLLHSAKFAVERRRIYEEDIADFPILPLEALKPEEVKKVCEYADRLCKERTDLDWQELNRWINELYGLEPGDEQVIADTLATRLPYSKAQVASERKPVPADIAAFTTRVEEVLTPVFRLVGESIRCAPVTLKTDPWIFVDLASSANTALPTDIDSLSRLTTAIAEHSGATRVQMDMGRGYLRVGMPAQMRFWTPTRARELALEVLRTRHTTFPIPEEA